MTPRDCISSIAPRVHSSDTLYTRTGCGDGLAMFHWTGLKWPQFLFVFEQCFSVSFSWSLLDLLTETIMI